MAINLTLNDFRNVLGKVNDGNVVIKQDQSGIEKANYGKYNWMERLDADSVLDALDRLADTAAAWRNLISDYHPEPPAADKAFPDGLDGHGLGESGFTQV